MKWFEYRYKESYVIVWTLLGNNQNFVIKVPCVAKRLVKFLRKTNQENFIYFQK